MKLTIIDDLLKAKPKKRGKILEEMHARNLAYFRKHASSTLVDTLTSIGSGRFEMRINNEFLDILDRRAGGAYCHPPGKLLEYLRDFGGWHHTAWIDRLSVTHVYLGEDEHSEVRRKLISGIYDQAQEVIQHLASGEVILPRLKDGRRYSGTTVFLGIHSGLHIAQYLNTTVVKDVIFIEPDMECLALSCFFLDYGAIHRSFGKVILHAGPDLSENPIDYLVSTASITAAVWLRMLPAYPSGAFDEVIRRISIRWNALHEIRVPCDRELRNLTYGARNLQAGLPVLASAPKLSEGSRIAVVASGPSLADDLPWLKDNQDKLIIIAAHSAVRVLRGAGIKPDFQCTLDTELDEPLLKKLDMYRDVPLIAYYKADPTIFENFSEVLLFTEAGKANVVDFNFKLTHTHPTSGNVAIALAVCFRPSAIYLAGLDLGFRDASKSHAPGTWHDDDEGAGHAMTQAADVLPAEANFEQSAGQIYTYSYLNNARSGVEGALSTVADTTRIVNLADGIRIAHASPVHSKDEILGGYPAKTDDLQAIRNAFSIDSAASWKAYPWTAAAALACFRESLVAEMTLRKFDWLAFARAVDTAWSIAATKNFNEGEGDFRIEAFGKLVQDLLTDWYRILCHTRTPAESEKIYQLGLSAFRSALESLSFAPELDGFAKSTSGLSGQTAQTEPKEI